MNATRERRKGTGTNHDRSTTVVRLRKADAALLSRLSGLEEAEPFSVRARAAIRRMERIVKDGGA